MAATFGQFPANFRYSGALVTTATTVITVTTVTTVEIVSTVTTVE